LGVAIDIDRNKIAEFCGKWKIAEFCVFGSVLRDDFGPDSDVDVMVSFAPGVRIGLRELCALERDLKEIFGRDVDLVTRRSVEEGRNWVRRNQILRNCERIQ